MGLPFASRQVVIDFLLATLLIFVVPLGGVMLGSWYFSEAEGMSEL